MKKISVRASNGKYEVLCGRGVLRDDQRSVRATAVVGEVTSLPPPPIEVNIDRPFMMAIVDRQTKTLVFLGRVLEPRL